MQFLIVLAILTVVVFVVSAPLRRDQASAPAGGDGRHSIDDELAELEAARDAKYREIRDAELDHRTGKLSEIDYEAVDQSLRAEAIEIMHTLDRVRARSGATIEQR